VLTVRYAFLYKIILCILCVLQLYLNSPIKISDHVIIRNRCCNIPSAIDISLHVNHFSAEFIIVWRVRRTVAECRNRVYVSSCLSVFVFLFSVCLSHRSHMTSVFLLNGFGERLCYGFLLKSADQIQVLLKQYKNERQFAWRRTLVHDIIWLNTSWVENIFMLNLLRQWRHLGSVWKDFVTYLRFLRNIFGSFLFCLKYGKHKTLHWTPT
jgi:hypothetical protein